VAPDFLPGRKRGSDLTEKNEHQVITANVDATLEHLKTLGVRGIQETRMTIDEIAVEILKGGGHVAHH
jgi:hypothetical protein